jgi:hypothetical protein
MVTAERSASAVLRDRWYQRDARYVERYAIRPSPFLDPHVEVVVRTRRIEEALELGDPVLVNEARAWRPPIALR